jgi:hypothetical protein
MSEENVQLVRSALPRPGTDLIAMFTDDSDSGELMQTVGRVLDPDFVSVKHFPGADPEVAHGLRGPRAGWLDWLAPWASYRAEIEELIDLGDLPADNVELVRRLCDVLANTTSNKGERGDSNPRPPGPQPRERGIGEARGPRSIRISAPGRSSVFLNLFPKLFPKRMFDRRSASPRRRAGFSRRKRRRGVRTVSADPCERRRLDSYSRGTR